MFGSVKLYNSCQENIVTNLLEFSSSSDQNYNLFGDASLRIVGEWFVFCPDPHNRYNKVAAEEKFSLFVIDS